MATSMEARVVATFRVMRKDLDPEQLSRDLGLAATESHRAGDPRPAREGRVYAPFSEGLWARSTSSPTLSPNEALRALIEDLRGREAQLANLRAQGHRTDVFLGLFGDEANVQCELDPGILRHLAELGLAVVLDVYCG